jgi:RNA polymerase sigma-70 factor (ECF subfamily)
MLRQVSGCPTRNDKRSTMSTPPSDELNAIVRRAQQGDANALTVLYKLYIQKIYRYIAYRVPDGQAEDLTAEVFVTMVEKIEKYRITEAPFESWLYRIAAARVADYYRQRSHFQNTELLDSLPIDESLPEEQLLDTEEVDALRKALQQLTPEQQSVLILRFVELKSHEEVASILNKSVSAVKTIQHRALNQIAHLFASEKQMRHYLRGRHD